MNPASGPPATPLHKTKSCNNAGILTAAVTPNGCVEFGQHRSWFGGSVERKGFYLPAEAVRELIFFLRKPGEHGLKLDLISTGKVAMICSWDQVTFEFGLIDLTPPDGFNSHEWLRVTRTDALPLANAMERALLARMPGEALPSFGL